MKSTEQSSSPREAANAFYGQDDAGFARAIMKLTANDPRLANIFNNVRKRHLEQKN